MSECSANELQETHTHTQKEDYAYSLIHGMVLYRDSLAVTKPTHSEQNNQGLHPTLNGEPSSQG